MKSDPDVSLHLLDEQIGISRKENVALSVRKAWDGWSAWADQHPALVLLAILFLALSMGIIKLQIDPPSPEFNWENRWWQIAVNVARGEGYVSCKPNYFPFCGPDNEVTAMREPLPVLSSRSGSTLRRMTRAHGSGESIGS